MARIRLRHEAWTTIERVTSTARMDPDSLEPIGDPSVTEYRLKAERVPQRHASPDYQPYDVDQQLRGHYIFLTSALARADFWPQVGDCMTKHGAGEFRDYVSNVDVAGHYRGGPQLCKAYYTDRAPASDIPRSHGGGQWSQ